MTSSAHRLRLMLALTIALVIAVALLAASPMRGHYKPATCEQLRAVVDPILLEPETLDLAEEERYERFVGAAAAADVNRFPDPDEVLEIWRDQEPRIKAILDILKEGPFARPEGRGRDERLMWLESLMIRGLPAAIDVNDHEAATGLIELTAWIIRRERESPVCLTGWMVSNYLERELSHGLLDALRDPNVPSEALEQFLAILPPPDKLDRALARFIRLDSQRFLSAYAPDPKTMDPGWKYAEGTYDAVETARMLSLARSAIVRNAMSPWSQADYSEPDSVMGMIGILPSHPGIDPGPVGWTEYRIYRLRMNRIPNSVGKSLINPGMASQVNTVSFLNRTRLEILRTLAALRLNERRHGDQAAQLKDLVTAGILTALPYDHFAEGPLQYDPVRLCLWSVGPDGRNDGGAFTQPLDRNAADYGVITTKP